jgi:hypothetical protein
MRVFKRFLKMSQLIFLEACGFLGVFEDSILKSSILEELLDDRSLMLLTLILQFFGTLAMNKSRISGCLFW